MYEQIFIINAVFEFLILYAFGAEKILKAFMKKSCKTLREILLRNGTAQTVTCTFTEILFFQTLLIVQKLDKCLASGSFKSNWKYYLQLEESITCQTNQLFKAFKRKLDADYT